jgi:hypothetical protein
VIGLFQFRGLSILFAQAGCIHDSPREQEKLSWAGGVTALACEQCGA